MTTKILCGVDGQAHSARAAAVATELAKQLDAELTLCAVIPVGGGRAGAFGRWPEEYIEKILAEAASRARRSGLTEVRRARRRGITIADAIIACADQHDVDYIVVGASERSRLLKLITGSVSQEVVAKAHCPVLIVGPARGHRWSRQ